MTPADDAFNAATYLLDRQVDAGRGDHPALVCEGRTTPYRELQRLTAAVAHGLRTLGTGAGERVVLVCSDRVELAAGILGAMRAGLVAVPVSTMLTGPELGKLVADSGAVAVVVTPEFADLAQVAVEAAPEVRHVVTVAGARLDLSRVAQVAWDDLVSRGEAEDVAPTTADTPALWLYTSGTTGTPKAAMHR
ncbi:MAG: AMP-binding protein, partial [Nocardioidaceae bacterium]